MVLAYRLDAISQDSKKLSISRAQPLARVMDAARIKSITHVAV